MREKIQRFMIGRYGADELAKAQSIAALVLLFLSMFSRLGIFYWLAIALMISSTVENVLEEYFRKICRKSEMQVLELL